MLETLEHSWWMTIRHVRALARQPWWIAVSLVQPLVYLFLFGALFERVVEIPGFGSSDYADFITPGIVVLTALYSGGWNGMAQVNDLDRGVIDRFLVSPARRSSLVAGPIGQLALMVIVQALIVVGLGATVGFSASPLGIAVLVALSVLLAAAVGAFSNGIALLARQEETVVALVQFLLLPLTFLSSVFMAERLMPGWMQDVARFNPVEWAVEAAREALSANVDWSLVGSRAGFLAAMALACGWFATRAFRAYQRSI